jgi:hypothetical protein
MSKNIDLENADLINAIRQYSNKVYRAVYLPSKYAIISTITNGVSGVTYIRPGGNVPSVLEDVDYDSGLVDIADIASTQLVKEAMQRGYSIDEILSPTPALNLSEEDRQYLLVYADHFEENGRQALASLFRDIAAESVKHSTRQRTDKPLPSIRVCRALRLIWGEHGDALAVENPGETRPIDLSDLKEALDNLKRVGGL